MATLKDFFQSHETLQEWIKAHDLKYLIETGTGLGDSIDFAKDHFVKAYSIEIIQEIYYKAQTRLESATNVFLICNNSKAGLRAILKDSKIEHPILFFLDAHFPGADFGLAEYDSQYGKDIRTPLEVELNVIFAKRGDLVKKDVFIIDDLRIYEDGPFGDGNWPHREKIGCNGIDFIYDLFAETHYIEKDYRFQGFIILRPIK